MDNYDDDHNNDDGDDDYGNYEVGKERFTIDFTPILKDL